MVGVYPSALHVAWSPPPHVDQRPVAKRSRPLIASLAVDVEPVVFWDGADPRPVDEVERWKKAVGFDDERQGSVRPGLNGPSGAWVAKNILGSLGVDPTRTAFTDAVPWFFTHRSAGSQGAAVEQRLAPMAERLGIDLGDLPKRPTKRALTEIAATEPRRSALRREILEAGAPLIISLGEEALRVVTKAVDDADGCPPRIVPTDYGRPGRVVIEGRSFIYAPLAHPGFQRRTKDPAWVRSLETWRKSTDHQYSNR